MIEALTFDWFGTLANHRHKGRRALFSKYLASRGLESAPWDQAVLYEVFDYYSRVYEPKSLHDEKLIFWTEFTRKLFERSVVTGSGADQPEIHAAKIRDIFGPDCFQLYPDVHPVLHELHRSGLTLAVVSNWHRGLKFFCHELNLSGLVGPVIASADIGIEKPDSRIFQEAARQLGVSPDRIVHIGDLPRDDFEGAIAAGLKSILIDRLNNYVTHPNRITSLFELRRQLAVPG